MAVIIESRMSSGSCSSSVKSQAMIAHSFLSEGSDDTITTTRLPPAIKINSKQTHKSLRRLLFSLTRHNRLVPSVNNFQSIPDLLLNLPVGPATYLRPLEHKLEPRLETSCRLGLVSTGNAPGVVEDMQAPSQEAIAIAKNRENTERILNGADQDDLSIVDLESSDDESGVGSDDCHTLSPEEDVSQRLSKFELKEIIEKEIANCHARIIHSAARDEKCVPAWETYVECYSKGKFSLIKPPYPPALHPNFTFLPAIFPDSEVQRRTRYESSSASWYQWSVPEATRIIASVVNTFKVNSASISYFDQDNEVFKIECGYNKPNVSREMSIAAHVLLSEDLFVILDAQKDWRFSANPLVLGGPKIRFFAGVPMLSHDGHAVGVLAIFSKSPRLSFSPEERRQLTDIGTQAMHSLIHHQRGDARLNRFNRNVSTPRSTPILQRDSIINGDYYPISSKSTAPSGHDQDLITVSVNFPATSTPRDRYSVKLHQVDQSGAFSNTLRDSLRHTRESDYSPITPSNASRHEKSRNEMLQKKGFMNNNNNDALSVKSDTAMFPFLQDMLIPEGRIYGIRDSRPFSASDITSLNLQPANTPCNSLIVGCGSKLGEYEIEEEYSPSIITNAQGETVQGVTIEEFLGMTDEDLSEEMYDSNSATDSSPLIDMTTPRPEFRFSNDRRTQNSIGSQTTVDDFATTSFDLPTAAETYEDSVYLFQDYKAELSYSLANGLCRYAAERLGYDIVYATELSPKEPNMTYSQLLAVGGLEKRIIAAYGEITPEDLTTSLHLDAIRSRGGFGFHVDTATDNEEVYETGYLLPVHTEDGPLEDRTSGIVFGAFRKRRLRGVDESEEAAKLRAMIDEHQCHLIRGTKDGLERLESIAATESNPYLAGEAVEIGNEFPDTPPACSRVRYIPPFTLEAHQSSRESRTKLSRQLNSNRRFYKQSRYSSPELNAQALLRRRYLPRQIQQEPPRFYLQSSGSSGSLLDYGVASKETPSS